METSFAEKLRIQAQDKKAAIREDFITRVVTNIKDYAQARADQGYFQCELTTDNIPDVIFPETYNKETVNQILLDIIASLRNNLENCRFTTLLINRSYIHSYSGISKTFTITCKW